MKKTKYLLLLFALILLTLSFIQIIFAQTQSTTTSGVYLENYNLVIENAENVNYVRVARGYYTTAAEIKSSDGMMSISESGVASRRDSNGKFTYEVPAVGEYSVWIRYTDSRTVIVSGLTNYIMTPTVSTVGASVTVKNLYGIMDLWVAKGECDTYTEAKANRVFRVSDTACFENKSYTYPASLPGDGVYTLMVRYNDTLREIYFTRFTVSVTHPEFKTYGRIIKVSNLDNVRAVRVANGSLATASEIKSASTCRTFSAGTIAKQIKDGTLNIYTDAENIGTDYSVFVEYKDRWSEIHHITVVKKAPSYEIAGDTIHFTNLSGLVTFRYAKGTFDTSAQIKTAEGSKYIRPENVKNSEITLSGLSGSYSFFVEYDDMSKNIINADINKVIEPEPITNVDVNPTKWDAVDSLGRVLVDGEKTKDETDGKFVGVFYWTWHEGHQIKNAPRVAGDIVKQFPDAVNNYSHAAWENTAEGTVYFWGTPLYGFYSTTDKWVLRRHAELLADAGVDVIIFDCTNGTFLWEDSTTALLETFTEAREDGVNTPQIAFMLNFSGNSNAKTELITLYDNIYSQGKYRDLWFYWEGKPLIFAWDSALDLESPSISSTKAAKIRSFFTFRYNDPSYFTQSENISTNRWGWMSNYPQAKYGIRSDGTFEEMCVSVAQNSTNTKLVAMNSTAKVHGRSYAKGDYAYYYDRYGTTVTVNSSIEDSMLYGVNFQQQWDYALKNNPDFIFVTGWNEWIAGRHKTWQGTENGFPDEFNEEFSRDIEPANGELKDNYYMQLCNNIRKYKGITAENTTPAEKTINISRLGADWKDITTAYDDYIDSYEARDWYGHGATHYTEEAVRNDIVRAKFAYDDDNLYFMVQTKDALTPSTDKNWMMLYVTVGDYKEDSWEGFDFAVNRENPINGKTSVEKLSSEGDIDRTGTAEIAFGGNTLVISVPRAALNIADGDLPTIRFKWVDNAINNDNPDIMDTYSHGDSAPNTRFMYKAN